MFNSYVSFYQRVQLVYHLGGATCRTSCIRNEGRLQAAMRFLTCCKPQIIPFVYLTQPWKITILQVNHLYIGHLYHGQVTNIQRVYIYIVQTIYTGFPWLTDYNMLYPYTINHKQIPSMIPVEKGVPMGWMTQKKSLKFDHGFYGFLVP